jgi:hypothetical protein
MPKRRWPVILHKCAPPLTFDHRDPARALQEMAAAKPLVRLPGFNVDGRNPDRALSAAAAKIEADGLKVRSISMGPDGVIAYAFDPREAVRRHG